MVRCAGGTMKMLVELRSSGEDERKEKRGKRPGGDGRPDRIARLNGTYATFFLSAPPVPATNVVRSTGARSGRRRSRADARGARGIGFRLFYPLLRRLETRFLIAARGGTYYGLVYEWNEQQTDAAGGAQHQHGFAGLQLRRDERVIFGEPDQIV